MYRYVVDLVEKEKEQKKTQQELEKTTQNSTWSLAIREHSDTGTYDDSPQLDIYHDRFFVTSAFSIFFHPSHLHSNKPLANYINFTFYLTPNVWLYNQFWPLNRVWYESALIGIRELQDYVYKNVYESALRSEKVEVRLQAFKMILSGVPRSGKTTF